MNLEFHLQKLVQDWERANKIPLPLKKLAESTGVSLKKIEKMEKPYLFNTDDITIREAVLIANYFNVSLGEFISYDDVPNNVSPSQKHSFISTRGDKKYNPYKDSKIQNSKDFFKSIEGSKNLYNYVEVPSLLEEIGKALDENDRLIVGCSENFNVKLESEAVLIRFTVATNGKVKVNDTLFGKSLGPEANGDNEYYKEIYHQYVAYKESEYVENEADVKQLLSILQTVI